MTRAVRPWLPALAWAALLFVLSSFSTVPGPRVVGLDKVVHFGLYAVLGLLLARAGHRSSLPVAAVVLLGAAYGASDEIHQMFVPGRTPDVLDWAADVAGVLTAVLLHTRWRARGAARDGGRADGAHSRYA